MSSQVARCHSIFSATDRLRVAALYKWYTVACWRPGSKGGGDTSTTSLSENGTGYGTGSLGHRVNGSFGSSFTSGSPGHHFDPVWDPSFSGFRKKCPKCKTYIWNAEMIKVIARVGLKSLDVSPMIIKNSSSHIRWHLEFITEQGHRVNWVSGSLDSRLTGSLGHKMWAPPSPTGGGHEGRTRIVSADVRGVLSGSCRDGSVLPPRKRHARGVSQHRPGSFPFSLDFQLPSAVPFLPSLWNYDPINFFIYKKIVLCNIFNTEKQLLNINSPFFALLRMSATVSK